MGFKTLLFVTTFAYIYFTSFVSTIDVCSFQSVLGYPCTTCNFLTFGQEKVVDGLVSYFCPNDFSSTELKAHCCYDLFRRPFCCDEATSIINGCLWTFVVLLIIYIIIKILKSLFRN